MGKDWIGNSHSGFYGLADSNRSLEEREEDDFYATPPFAVEKLLETFSLVGELPARIIEPAIGKGHIAEVLKRRGYNVEGYDVVDRGYPSTIIQSFLEVEQILGEKAIITNPLYKYAIEFVKHSLNLLNNNEYCIMLLKLQFLEGKERGKFYREGNNPKYVFVFSDRINCAKKGDFEKEKETGGMVAYAWYVWQKGFTGETIVKWI